MVPINPYRVGAINYYFNIFYCICYVDYLNKYAMNRIVFFLTAIAGICMIACSDKDDEKDKDYFTLLTRPTWVADSLLANGVDASGPGQALENFKGEAKFRTDGSGTFGSYSGTWTFSSKTQITINSPDFLIPIFAEIIELHASSLKITTVVPDMNNAGAFLNIRMTFNAK